MLETIFLPYVITPLLIVLARMTDVSLGTLRIILVSKGYKKIAPIISFMESLIWITVAGQIIRDVSNWTAYVAYALGYALGTYVGMKLDTKLSLGKVFVRVIVAKDYEKLVHDLRDNKFGVTVVPAEGKNGMVYVLFVVLNRTELDQCVHLIQANNPSAFFTIESIQSTNAGYFTDQKNENAFTRFGRTIFLHRK